MPKPWYLYMLECAGGRLYTGVTVDVSARYKAHAEGRGAKFTRSFPPLRILFVERWPSRSEALKAEHAIKKLSPEAKRKLVESTCQTAKP
ncbi:MAG: GIY-YIG nuclease family protein [Parvibaculum sp.]|uniref:GIY-YIG nuclease family protein n=1 Tax=Parvibaculum sp. TaxID=2024848 RepID=UPI002B8A4E78|nr:GIY-YIG nuclease family protein [Parvibaculum sp.]HMM15734.1 GIY-YIG nuclease family protein [Parvibaculum sp.]